MRNPRLPFIIAAHNSVIVHWLRTTTFEIFLIYMMCTYFANAARDIYDIILFTYPDPHPCQLGFLPPPLPLFQLQILQYFLPFFAHGDAIHSSHSHNNISGPSSFCAPYTHSIILRFRSQCQQQNRTHISAFAEWR